MVDDRRVQGLYAEGKCPVSEVLAVLRAHQLVAAGGLLAQGQRLASVLGGCQEDDMVSHGLFLLVGPPPCRNERRQGGPKKEPRGYAALEND